MKKAILALAIIPFWIGDVSAESFTFNPSIVIRDDDIVNGDNSISRPPPVTDSHTISSSITSIQSITVTLDISGVNGGAFNGDLYAQLQYSDGGSPVQSFLLNRIGKINPDQFPGDPANPSNDHGNAGNGMQIQLSDSAATDVHSSPDIGNTVLTGTWQPDGRSTVPSGNVSASDTRDALLAVFDGKDVNGTWTLLIGDASSGGQAKLDTWGLEFTGVPEPREWAAISAAALLGFGIWRRTKQNKTQVIS